MQTVIDFGLELRADIVESSLILGVEPTTSKITRIVACQNDTAGGPRLSTQPH